jgi:hypothetical protein
MAQTTIRDAQLANDLGGWIPANETWTYVSADAPTFTFTVAADVTVKYSAGMRVKYTQTTVKYGIITAVSAYSGGNTTITIYGGTDYTMTSATISNNFYSTQKAPQGFPLSPAKWRVTTTDTTQRSQATPTTNVWYNLGSVSITVPIGVWDVRYKVNIIAGGTSQADITVSTTLSTANNSSSDAELFSSTYGNTLAFLATTEQRDKVLTLTSKTVYYLNSRGQHTGLNLLRNDNNASTLYIYATCAYL